MLDRLMEIAIIKYDIAWRVGLSKCDIIIEDKLEGWVANEVALHLYAPVYWGVDDIAWWVEEDVDLLVDVDENLILIAFVADTDARGWWVDGVGAEDREVPQLLFDIQDGRWLLFDYFAGYEGFDVWGVGELRVSEVYDLVEYLINEHKVLPDGLLIDDPTEILNDDHDAVQQLQDIGRGYVEASRSNHINRWFLEVCKIDALNVEDRFRIAFWELDLTVKQLRSVFDEIGTEVAVYYGVPAGW